MAISQMITLSTGHMKLAVIANQILQMSKNLDLAIRSIPPMPPHIRISHRGSQIQQELDRTAYILICHFRVISTLYNGLSKGLGKNQENDWILNNESFFASERRWKFGIESFGNIAKGMLGQDIEDFLTHTHNLTSSLKG